MPFLLSSLWRDLLTAHPDVRGACSIVLGDSFAFWSGLVCFLLLYQSTWWFIKNRDRVIMVLGSGKTSRVVASGACFLLTGTWQKVPLCWRNMHRRQEEKLGWASLYQNPSLSYLTQSCRNRLSRFMWANPSHPNHLLKALRLFPLLCHYYHCCFVFILFEIDSPKADLELVILSFVWAGWY